MVPPASPNTDANVAALVQAGEGRLRDDEKGGFAVFTDDGKPQEATADLGFCSKRSSNTEEKERAVAERPTQLDLVGLDPTLLPYTAAPDGSGEHAEQTGSKACHDDSPRSDFASDQLPSTSSSEWEDHMHLA